MMVAGSSRLQCFHSDALAGHFMLPPRPQPRSFTGASSGRVCVWLHCAFAVAHRLSVVAAGEGYSPVAVGELLLTAASAVAEHGLQGKWAAAVAAPRLQGTGSAVVAHRLSCPPGVWNLSGPGIEPVSSALAGGSLNHWNQGSPPSAS